VTFSNGSTVRVDATIGTPVLAAALATARSPCPSWAQMPMTPIGAMKIGVASFMPNSLIDMSLFEPSTIILGTSPHF
jgi:hypothetical protein